MIESQKKDKRWKRAAVYRLAALFAWRESMAREFAKAFYNSKRWKKCRAAYISYRKSIDGGLCETCHDRPGYIVHHKTELNPDNINDQDIALGFSNLKYDCHICHQKEDMKDGPAAGLIQYDFSPEGEVIPRPP